MSQGAALVLVFDAKGCMDNDKLTIKQAFTIGGISGQMAFDLAISKDEANDVQALQHPFWAKVRQAYIESFESLVDERRFLPLNLDPRLEIDRSKPVGFLGEGEEYLFPDLQEIGPDEPDMNTLERWLHPDQEKVGKKCLGDDILSYLKDSGDIRYCLSVREFDVIQKRGGGFFEYYLKGRNNFFAWRSIKKLRTGSVVVPYFHEQSGEVYSRARFLDGEWVDSDFALLASKPF